MRGLGCLGGLLLLVGCQAARPHEPSAGGGASAPSSVFFTPRFAAFGSTAASVERVCLDTTALDGHEAIDAEAARVVGRLGLTAADASDCDWRIEFAAGLPALDGDALAAWAAVQARPERFAFVTDTAARPARTTIVAGSPRAALFALRAAASYAEPDGQGRVALAELTVVDAPAFAVRGVVEGFYGPPYADAERQELIRLMGELRQNLYVYAPQNDVFDHVEWYAPYPDDALQPLAAAVQAAADAQIDFVWAVRPGLGLYATTDHPIQYSSDDDFSLLTDKIEQLRGIGVRDFGLFFDDNVNDFTNDADRGGFGSLAAAHAALLDRLDDYLRASDPAARLMMVGTRYAADQAGWQAYNEDLRARLHSAIDVFWTGNQTYSQTIGAADLYPVADSLGREPIIWDNWPPSRAVFALDGRAADLPEAASGFVSNPVQSSWQHHPIGDFERILGTDASYAWNPEAYRADAAFAAWSAMLPDLLADQPAAP